MNETLKPGARTPAISLIVCTRNRAQALGRCLNAIARADYSEAGAELVVVDNGSSDNTSAVIQRFAKADAVPLRYVLEKREGLSHARNAGASAARGALLAFTDDDCYVATSYFTALRDAYHEAGVDYSGGRILLHDPADAFYACNDLDKFELIAPYSFISAGRIQGANMAMTRRLYETVGPFDPALGAGTPFRCEDVDYIARASAAGFRGAHLPGVVVFHHHGRKEGADLEGLRRDNDYARGAYYAKRVLQGDLTIPMHWGRVAWRERRNHRLAVELRGALHYLRSRLGARGTGQR